MDLANTNGDHESGAAALGVSSPVAGDNEGSFVAFGNTTTNHSQSLLEQVLNNEDELNNVYEDYNNNNDFIKSDVDITAVNDEDDNATSLERSVSEQTREAETQTDPISDEQLVVFSEDDGTAEYASGYATTMTVFGRLRRRALGAKRRHGRVRRRRRRRCGRRGETIKVEQRSATENDEVSAKATSCFKCDSRKTRTTNDAFDGHLVKSDASRICHSGAKRRRHEHAEQQKLRQKQTPELCDCHFAEQQSRFRTNRWHSRSVQ